MQTVQLNLTPSGVPPTVFASRYDVGRKFIFELYEDAATFEIPSDAVVYINGTKPDMHSFTYSTKDASPNVSFSGNAVTVTSTEQMTAEPGNVTCELVIKRDTTVLGTLNFRLIVEPGAMPEDADTSASDLMAYQDMVDRTHASEVAAAKSAADADESYKKTAQEHEETVKDVAEQRTQINKDIDTKQAEINKDIDTKQAEIQKLIDNFNKGSFYSEDITLLASGWVGTEAPYSYTITQATDTSVLFIDMAMPGITEDQLYAISAAKLAGSKGNILYANGEKPDIDIPIRIIYLKGDN